MFSLNVTWKCQISRQTWKASPFTDLPSCTGLVRGTAKIGDLGISTWQYPTVLVPFCFRMHSSQEPGKSLYGVFMALKISRGTRDISALTVMSWTLKAIKHTTCRGFDHPGHPWPHISRFPLTQWSYTMDSRKSMATDLNFPKLISYMV